MGTRANIKTDNSVNCNLEKRLLPPCPILTAWIDTQSGWVSGLSNWLIDWANCLAMFTRHIIFS